MEPGWGEVEAGVLQVPGKTEQFSETLSQILKKEKEKKKVWGHSSVMECLPSKLTALGLIPSREWQGILFKQGTLAKYSVL